MYIHLMYIPGAISISTWVETANTLCTLSVWVLWWRTGIATACFCRTCLAASLGSNLCPTKTLRLATAIGVNGEFLCLSVYTAQCLQVKIHPVKNKLYQNHLVPHATVILYFRQIITCCTLFNISKIVFSYGLYCVIISYHAACGVIIPINP